MKITVAGRERAYPDGATLLDVTQAENVENPRYITAVVNDDYVRYDDFAAAVLQDGDNVEFVYFMGGGDGAHK